MRHILRPAAHPVNLSFALVAALACLSLLSAAQCDDSTVVELDSAMRVSPENLDFGLAAISQDQMAWVTVANPSALDLGFTVELAPDSDPAFRLADDLPQLVPHGASVKIPVLFRPVLESQVSGRLIFNSDSRQDPYAEVVLLGSGVDRGHPHLEIEPNPVDFAAIGLGEVSRVDVALRNTGTRDLLLDAIQLIDDGASDDGAGAFVLATTAPAGFVVRPSDEIALQLVFSPPSLGTFNGTVRIESNDPGQPQFDLSLVGMGHEAPVAVLQSLDPVDSLKPFDSLRLDASQSYSPDLAVSIVRYIWRLSVRPQGSTTVLRSQDGRGEVDLETTEPRVDLLLDLAGRYEVLLDVIDSNGLRSAQPALLRLRAVPDEDLHLQLVWDHPTADLDLHYLRNPDGLFDHAQDCYFSNRYPDWYPDDPEANPRLDVDDQGGFGPENINVLRPQAGLLYVDVHYWDARTSGDAATQAILRVYVRGQLAAEFSHYFEHDEMMWSALVLQWPDSLDGQVVLTPVDTVESYRRPF